MTDPSADEMPFQEWVGRTEAAREVIHPELVRRHNATIPGAADSGDLAPLGIHWCLAPSAFSADLLGTDGHPGKGLNLPPVPLSRRMWAGGALRFSDPLRPGDDVERISKIEAITRKAGRAGPLWMVAVRHVISTRRGVAVEEEQNIVYTGMEQPATPIAREAGDPLGVIATYFADPVLLFRFSAITFNAHRIHYDFNYATQAEGYPDLVVQGPLQATLLMRIANARFGGIGGMVYRAVRPLFCNQRFHITGVEDGRQKRLDVVDQAGVTTMRAEFH